MSMVLMHLTFATALELAPTWKPKAPTAFKGIPTIYKIRIG